jgi:hypothetical protein
MFQHEIAAQTSSQMTPPRVGAPPLQKDGTVMQVIVCRSDAEVMVTKSYRQKGTLPIWTNYLVYKEIPDHYYVGQPAPDDRDLKLETRIGWVQKEHLLDQLESLRTVNKIYRRIIVFNNRQENRVPVYAAPVHDAGELHKTPLFSFFYIYKETEDYHLIGTSPSITLEDPGRDVLGWIHKKNCHEWNTRLAVNYQTTTKKLRLAKEQEQKQGLVRIYQTSDAAVQASSNGAISQETSDASWQYNMLCYPLLQSKTVDQKRLFEIAFLSGEKSDDTQETIARIKEEKVKLYRLDMLLLIDGSASPAMRDKITIALQKMVKKIETEKTKIKLDIAWGMAFYHDFEKNRQYPYRRGRLFQPKVIHIYDFFPDLHTMLRELYNEFYRGGRYETKSLYYGLDMVAQNIKWREGSTRCLVTVGVTGNHAAEDPQDVTKLTMPEIKEELQKNSIRLWAAQFEDHDKYAVMPSVQAFARQMTELGKSLGEGGYFLLSAAENNYRPKSFHLENLLEILLDLYNQEIPLVDEAINDLALGFHPDEVIARYDKNWDALWQRYSRLMHLMSLQPEVVTNVPPTFYVPQLKTRLDSFLQRHKIALTELRSKGVFYSKGWVCEYQPFSNIQQAQVRLLIDKIELSRLIGFLSSLSLELKSASRPEQYVQIWKTLLQTMFGIDTIPPDEPLDNLIVQHSGLPFMNGLLQYTLDDFVTKARNNDFRNDIIKKLDFTCDRLLMVAEEKETEKAVTSDNMNIVRKKKRWWQEAENLTPYAWLEVEIFP